MLKSTNPKYIARSYGKIAYPEQSIQIDVKFMISACLVNEAKGQRLCQYCHWWILQRFVEAFEKHNSYSSALFPEHLIRAFPCPVACVQTEIGQKFKKRFNFCGSFDKSAILQIRLKKHGIRHNWYVSLPEGITKRWKEATVRRMRGFIPLILLFLWRTCQTA